ncbi:MAG: hypothetical protein ABMA64_14115, partial [Myxococcota bacterium]
PPPAPRRRRWWPLAVVLLAMGAAAGGAATLAALTLGSSAMVGALVVAAMEDGDTLCGSVVHATRQTAQRERVRGLRKSAKFFDGAHQACSTASAWDVAQLMGHFSRITRDGELSEGDRVELDFRLRELTPVVQ